MRLLAGTTDCVGGNCPTVWLADDGNVVVQGYTTDLATPPGEQAVTLPPDLIQRAAAALAKEG